MEPERHRLGYGESKGGKRRERNLTVSADRGPVHRGRRNETRGGRRRRAERADQAGRSGVERVQTSGREVKTNRYNMLP